ncbi:bifunctional proline dehydrogenase/L-glutamate gamma-semialdehyde dehydrogenase PutA [Amphritea sp. 2_MG-2023]|uniref:bifunctional proline dehydrogenase/L-glutamate gamma-semialdehyde dehydrogenase PutA n=1 Tax=Amphritea TaxID=515417 RepID=UPI001C07BE97|nr:MULTISPECIES: bifunctional proline dehydrogenase/L-glutamate gamma-semialdehyde dehydrogenase PutA [Amphritea]MBU2965561.1 bifunctional proline dehydrogenase/L-glutamate gamma-semialdehyde dehydrogenase PutA [Amphritea atlantica]MDO6418716.1 bifunctional proline dehydrogenase/L-glutamate gamma-semialdehyde dehydrogenase PutA [Amphritea sp. 2_MG-2023]
MTNTTDQLRIKIREHYLANESQIIRELMSNARMTIEDRQQISTNAAQLVTSVRQDSSPSMMEKFLGEYGLTTKEGVALMCLAEALLRVPDALTIDALIEDKVASGNWGEHLGKSKSSLVNSSTWALLLTGKLIAPSEDKGVTQTVRGMVKRLGEPLVRTAVGQAMKELGRQFVLGRTIEEATKRARKLEKQGYSYSYDMLGEAARTDADALRYHQAYSVAIGKLTPACIHSDIRMNPGISVKLSALHARYEFAQKDRVMTELVERTKTLAQQAKQANMGFNIDAEEQDRLDLSLDVIEAVLADESLADWDGFGIVVQAFGPRTSFVLEWLYALATRLDRKIMVRLVKGAYWDAEIKRAQEMGLDGFPVYTRKVNSDVSYLCCAEKLLGMTDRIYPQFATHNAHSVSGILHLARHLDNKKFEFQRLHGMGESLHDTVLQAQGTRCRIYAPVGAHRDLLAYLVRRLLENGANSSFVNQIVDTRIKPEEIARDPFAAIEAMGDNISSAAIARPEALFGDKRKNARGWDLTDPVQIAELEAQQAEFKTAQWHAAPMIAGSSVSHETVAIHNPAIPDDCVGQVINSAAGDIETAIVAAQEGFGRWSQKASTERAACLRQFADLLEQNAAELFTLVTREAGKTLLDAVGELREAVDFARFYANEAERNAAEGEARGVITCISPWNFPMAIFSGQVLAALAAGNAVLAKPADQTPLIAARTVALMHQAGIPADVIQLLPGSGVAVGAPLTSDSRIAGVCFTGSTLTAQRINRVMAENMAPDAPLVAETGGMNAMIVDSTALPEQVVRDVLASSFQSAGQRCSALRVLYLQKDIADNLLEMLFGAMDELRVGNPALLSTDVGPVIDQTAKAKIEAHCAKYAAKGKVLKSLAVPEQGLFVAPTVIKIESIAELEEEIFGPVLHVVTFDADCLDQVVDSINATGYGLTFGLHTRVDNRVNQICNRIKAGNLYVNRNQIGAVVGSQPFGGEGLSGTGPKAGGPQYVKRFMRTESVTPVTSDLTAIVGSASLQQAIDSLDNSQWAANNDRLDRLQTLFNGQDVDFAALQHEAEVMPGPTGELNVLSTHARGVVLCLGPDLATAMSHAVLALSQGNAVVVVAPKAVAECQVAIDSGLPIKAINGLLQPDALADVTGFAAVASGADLTLLQAYRVALASREGVIIPLITERHAADRFSLERHLCIDTTAAGGNASLIAASE